MNQCCGRRGKRTKISGGYTGLTVPPGCYILTARIKDAKGIHGTMVVLNSDKSARVNLLPA